MLRLTTLLPGLRLPNLRPIDATARDGELRFVSNGRTNASARWHDDAWRFANGHPLPFEPTEYQP